MVSSLAILTGVVTARTGRHRRVRLDVRPGKLIAGGVKPAGLDVVQREARSPRGQAKMCAVRAENSGRSPCSQRIELLRRQFNRQSGSFAASRFFAVSKSPDSNSRILDQRDHLVW